MYLDHSPASPYSKRIGSRVTMPPPLSSLPETSIPIPSTRRASIRKEDTGLTPSARCT